MKLVFSQQSFDNLSFYLTHVSALFMWLKTTQTRDYFQTNRASSWCILLTHLAPGEKFNRSCVLSAQGFNKYEFACAPFWCYIQPISSRNTVHFWSEQSLCMIISAKIKYLDIGLTASDKNGNWETTLEELTSVPSLFLNWNKKVSSIISAPEVVSMEPYGHAVDWWSLGVVACCMLSGQVGPKQPTSIPFPLMLRGVLLVVKG